MWKIGQYNPSIRPHFKIKFASQLVNCSEDLEKKTGICDDIFCTDCKVIFLSTCGNKRTAKNNRRTISHFSHK